jgi:hypothetical protein
VKYKQLNYVNKIKTQKNSKNQNQNAGAMQGEGKKALRYQSYSRFAVKTPLPSEIFAYYVK